MPFGIKHDEHYALVIVMAIARPGSTQALDVSARNLDIIDLNVEMKPHLRGLRF